MDDFKTEIGQYLSELSKTVNALDFCQINSAMNVLMETYDKGGRVFIFGNGGSAATASHFASDFNSIRLKKKKFDFICLNDNIPTMLSIANDYGYENIFFLQLKDRLMENDILIAISGKGNSKNVVKAVECAKKNGNKILALTGYDGGELMKLADHPIHVNINDMQKSEDVHMIIGHLIFQIIASKLGHKMC